MEYGRIPHLCLQRRSLSILGKIRGGAQLVRYSVYGQIKTASWGTMGHAVADKRMYCHEALHNPDYNFTSKARREVGHGLGHGRVRRRGGPRRVNGVQAV